MTTRFSPFARKFAVTAAGVLLAQSVQAATVNLATTDALNQTSFAADTLSHWNPAGAPTSGNTYVVTNLDLRTPATGNGLTFAGDSLTISGSTGNGGRLLFKTNAGTDQTYTFNNGGLILSDNGSVLNATDGNRAQTIAGTFTVASTGGRLQHNNQAINVSAATTLNGTLSYTTAGNNRTSNWSGNVAFGTSGKISFDAQATAGNAHDLTQTSASTFTFDIGAAGTTYISGANATGSVGSFNGTFAFTLGAEDLVLGRTWTIVDTSTFAESFSGTFAVNGFTESSNVWTSSNGFYQFSESNGILSVVAVPEPSTFAALAGLAVLGVVGARRRRR